MSATDLDRLICNRNGTLQTQGEQQTHAAQHEGSTETLAGLWAATTRDEGTLRLRQKCGGHERHTLPEPQQLSFRPAKNATSLGEEESRLQPGLLAGAAEHLKKDTSFLCKCGACDAVEHRVALILDFTVTETTQPPFPRNVQATIIMVMHHNFGCLLTDFFQIFLW